MISSRCILGFGYSQSSLFRAPCAFSFRAPCAFSESFGPLRHIGHECVRMASTSQVLAQQRRKSCPYRGLIACWRLLCRGRSWCRLGSAFARQKAVDTFCTSPGRDGGDGADGGDGWGGGGGVSGGLACRWARILVRDWAVAGPEIF